MKISNLQFSFILIKALPESYSAVALTILATGELKDLTPQTIQDQILNEEGRHSSASTSLNKITLVKRKGNKVDKSSITCYYCQKIRHKSNECRKKKKDAEEKDKKEKEKAKGSSVQKTKSVNAHVSTATIEEVDDNIDIPISLYTTAQARWMVDSGATHHITPYCSDFIEWTLA